MNNDLDAVTVMALRRTHEAAERYKQTGVAAMPLDHVRDLVMPGLTVTEGRHPGLRLNCMVRDGGLVFSAANTRTRKEVRESIGSSQLGRLNAANLAPFVDSLVARVMEVS